MMNNMDHPQFAI